MPRDKFGGDRVLLTDAEVKIGLSFLKQQSDPKSADQQWSKYAQVLLASNEFSYLD